MSWYELGKMAGVDVVEEEEVEAEVEEGSPEDKEVAQIYKSNREKHDKLQKGTVQYIVFKCIACHECRHSSLYVQYTT